MNELLTEVADTIMETINFNTELHDHFGISARKNDKNVVCLFNKEEGIGYGELVVEYYSNYNEILGNGKVIRIGYRNFEEDIREEENALTSYFNNKHIPYASNGLGHLLYSLVCILVEDITCEDGMEILEDIITTKLSLIFNRFAEIEKEKVEKLKDKIRDMYYTITE